jgi:tetratricopeptide (TPR) repeat protein
MKEFKFSQALNLIDKEMEKKYNLKVLYYYKGNIMREMFSYNEAIKSYLAAYAIDSIDNTILINLANTYQSNKQYDSSIYYFSRALSLDPTNKYLALEIATNRFLSEQWNQAKECFFKLYQKDTSNYYVITKLAYCYNRLNIIDSAFFYLNQACILNPLDANNLKSYCVTSIAKKDYKAGIKKTEQFILKDSNNFEITSLNAYLYLLDKQYRSSILKYLKCIERKFNSFQIYKNLGIAYYRLNTYDSAKIFLEKAYYIDSLDVNNIEFLSSACLNSYYKELGIFYYEKYIELSGYDIVKYSEVYQNLYDACWSWSKCPSEKLLSVSLFTYRLNPEKLSILYNIGYCYDTRQKDYPKAIEYYTKYLSEKKKIEEPSIIMKGGYNLDKIVEIRIKELKDFTKQNLQ